MGRSEFLKSRTRKGLSLFKPRDKAGSRQSTGLGLMRLGFGVQMCTDSLSHPRQV